MEVCAFLFFPWNFYLSIIEVIGSIAGPGCSSVGGGAFTELGPFYPTGDGRGLRINSMSWNKASNLLFVESPAGVGWSYSNTSSDYNTGDETTGENSASLFFQVISLLFLWHVFCFLNSKRYGCLLVEMVRQVPRVEISWLLSHWWKLRRFVFDCSDP